MRHLLLLLLCALIPAGWACGDTSVFISVNSGTILGAPRCASGQFDLLEPGGLTVLVVITSNTHIVLASGGTGGCTNLAADTPVQVTGHRRGDQITATVVSVE